jgi:HAD superfamily hydrolase (TIGR01509 family)
MPLIHVFDLGNVLLFVHEDLFYRRMRPRCGYDGPLEKAFNAQYERARIDRGGDFREFHNALVRDMALEMSFDEFRLMWNDIFTPNPPMLEVVREAPRPRVLLSNTNEPHVAWIREHYPDIFPLFDQCVFSNEVGRRKPEKAIFRHVELLTGEPPERHVFVDDVPAYVEAARAAGWQAIQYRDPAQVRRRLAELSAGD